MVWERYLSHLVLDIEQTVSLFGPRWIHQVRDLNYHDTPVYVQAPTPAALFVNREAREVVISWADTNGLQLRFCEETKGHIYVRKWERGPVYVPPERWAWFRTLVWDEVWGSESFGGEDSDQESHEAARVDPRDAPDFRFEFDFDDIAIHLTHLVLPAETVYWRTGQVNRILAYIRSFRKLSVVWGDLPVCRYEKLSSTTNSRRLDGLINEAERQPTWVLEAESPQGEHSRMARTTSFRQEDRLDFKDFPATIMFPLERVMASIRKYLQGDENPSLSDYLPGAEIVPVKVIETRVGVLN